MRFDTRLLAAACAALMIATGCNDSLEDNVTIDQGVAGEYISHSDIAGEDSSPIEGEEVFVYPATNIVDGAPVGDAVDSVRTDEEGFFELSLTDGDYVIGIQPTKLITEAFTVAGGVMRCDLSATTGGRSWDCQPL